jgi:hypothetical protein
MDSNTGINAGYEVPQPLRYQEKLFGPVSFVQAGYLAMGAILSGVIYKAGGLNPFPLFLIVIINSTCIGLSFFKLGPKIKARVNFYKTPQKLGYLDVRLNNLIGVTDVRSDMLVKKDGKKYAILQIKPINFMIKSEEDREAIIVNFQKFLNCIDYPIQILVRTVNMNLTAYVDHLRTTVGQKVKRTKNLNLQRLFDDYYRFVNDKIINTAAKNRMFYLIIPVPSGSEEESEAILESRVSVCSDSLASCGLQTRRLNSMQIVSLLSSFFESHVEVDNDYLFPVTMLKNFKAVYIPEEVEDETITEIPENQE